jgi:hypothetical protein
MKRIFLLLLVSFAIISCGEDVDKEISTDLAAESTQLFDNSKTWGESLYFALLPYANYLLTNPSTIPGCPSVNISAGTRMVVLDFDNPGPCEQPGTTSRTGRIILDFSRTVGNTGTWTMAYENYTFQKTKLNGIRTFRRNTNASVFETFENLTIQTEKKLTSILSGDFTHSLILQNNLLTGFSSTGKMSGINAAGRQISIEIISPRSVQVNCLSQNNTLPTFGKETWEVSREKNQTLSYAVEYQQIQSCASLAVVTLPDGRQLQLNP